MPTTGTMTRRLLPTSGTNRSSSLLSVLAAHAASRASSTCVNRKNSQNSTANTPRSNSLSKNPRTACKSSSAGSLQQQRRGGHVNAVNPDQEVKRLAQRAEEMMLQFLCIRPGLLGIWRRRNAAARACNSKTSRSKQNVTPRSAQVTEPKTEPINVRPPKHVLQHV